jgi:hypothetical protein
MKQEKEGANINQEQDSAINIILFVACRQRM